MQNRNTHLFNCTHNSVASGFVDVSRCSGILAVNMGGPHGGPQQNGEVGLHPWCREGVGRQK